MCSRSFWPGDLLLRRVGVVGRDGEDTGLGWGWFGGSADGAGEDGAWQEGFDGGWSCPQEGSVRLVSNGGDLVRRGSMELNRDGRSDGAG